MDNAAILATGKYKIENNRISKVKENSDWSNNTGQSTVRKSINIITGQTHRLLINIKLVFTHMNEEMLSEVIVSVIRSRLEYATITWSSYM